MSYVLYVTTCSINGKTYHGITNNNTPGYLGSGDWKSEINKIKAKSINPDKQSLKEAIKLHGKEHFYRVDLQIFETIEEAKKAEADIVTEEYVKSNSNYNLCPGGGSPPIGSHKGYKHSEKTKQEWSKKRKGIKPWNTNKTLSEEHIEKLSLSHKGQHSSPSTEFKPGNVYGSNKGMRWITDGTKSKMIFSNTPLPNGWVWGRTFQRPKGKEGQP